VRAIRLAVAFSLIAGVALSAGSAWAQRIDGNFPLIDDVAGPNPDGNQATVQILGRSFGVAGEVSGVGTSGDQVAILYNTDEPTNASANNKNGKVQQGRFTTLNFLLVPGTSGNAPLNLNTAPEKCKANASVDPAKGKVSVNCTGDNIFLNISAGQLDSFIAAFQDRKDVKINVTQTGSKGTLKITLNQK